MPSQKTDRAAPDAPTLRPLAGKCAAVTGSTSGIGLAIARALAAQGADVMLNGRARGAGVDELVADMASTHRVKVLFEAADLGSTAGARGFVAAAEAGLGRVDILVNNAGIQHVAPVDDFPEERLDAILRLNFFAVFHTMAAVIPGMKARRSGRIINITSAHALIASPCKAPYVASKHAVTGLTKSAALEVAAHGITVNCIAPGYVWTALVEKQIPDTMAARGLTRDQVIHDVMLKPQPTGRFITVEEVGAAACFLAGEGAASMTGSTLVIDGGWTAQ